MANLPLVRSIDSDFHGFGNPLRESASACAGRIIALARAGRSVESVTREFEPCAATISGWLRQAGIDGGARDDGPTSLEREELRRLRKENLQSRMERDILL